MLLCESYPSYILSGADLEHILKFEKLGVEPRRFISLYSHLAIPGNKDPGNIQEGPHNDHARPLKGRVMDLFVGRNTFETIGHSFDRSHTTMPHTECVSLQIWSGIIEGIGVGQSHDDSIKLVGADNSTHDCVESAHRHTYSHFYVYFKHS